MPEDLEIDPPIEKGFLFLWIGSGKSCESKG